VDQTPAVAEMELRAAPEVVATAAVPVAAAAAAAQAARLVTRLWWCISLFRKLRSIARRLHPGRRFIFVTRRKLFPGFLSGLL
jgi:hypothetical protein